MKILAISVLLLSMISGCASYNPGVFSVGSLSNDINVHVDNGVKVYINIPDFPTNNIFSCDLEAYGIMPAYISITNNSLNHYSFSTKDINYEFIPAAEAAEKCGFSVLVSGGIFPPTIARVRSINKAIMNDYLSKEIPKEAIIFPGWNICGVVFLKKNVNLNRINIILNNVTTNSKIKLGVDNIHALTKSNFDVVVGEKYFTQTNLHLSDGNTIYSDNYLDGKLIPLGTGVTIISADKNTIGFKTDDGKTYALERGKHQVNSILFEMTPELFFGKSNPLNSNKYNSLTDSEKFQIRLGIPQEGMSKELVAYALGHPVSQESPYFDGIKWSYWTSDNQPLYIFFDINNKVFNIHNGNLVQNEEYAIRIERQLRTYIGVHKSTVVIKLGPPERTTSDGSGGEILIYDNFVPIKAMAASISSEQFLSHFRSTYFSTTSGVTNTTYNPGYKEYMRVSIYTNQNGSVYLVRCNATLQEGGIKYQEMK